MDNEKIIIELPNNKKAVLTLLTFEEIDCEDITKIHYHNIMGEVLTCSTLLNRMGNLLAEVDEMLSSAKLDFEIFFAHEAEKKRKSMTVSYTNTKGNQKYEPPTNTAVEQAIIITPSYKAKKNRVITLQKQRDVVNSLYWAVKDKSDKISKITDKLRPESFEKDLLEETINGVQIKIKEKLLKR